MYCEEKDKKICSLFTKRKVKILQIEQLVFGKKREKHSASYTKKHVIFCAVFLSGKTQHLIYNENEPLKRKLRLII